MNGAPPCRLPRPTADDIWEGARGETRSYDHRERLFSWRPPAGYPLRRASIDVEAKDSPADALGAHFGLRTSVFLRRWTALEALAKATDQPVFDLLRHHGLAEAAADHWSRDARTGVWLCRVDHPTHWVTLGVVPGPR